MKFSYNNEWSDDEEDDDDSDEDESDSVDEDNEYPNKFGPIPRFSRVYEVTVHPDTLVFSCTCYHQERMGLPCRHIASICRSNTRIFVLVGTFGRKAGLPTIVRNTIFPHLFHKIVKSDLRALPASPPKMFALRIQNGRDESNVLLLFVDRHYRHFCWLAAIF
jgi:hypothetical protein